MSDVKIFDLDRFAKFKHPSSDSGITVLFAPHAIAAITEIVGNNTGVFKVVLGRRGVELPHSVPWGEFEAEVNRSLSVVAEHQALAEQEQLELLMEAKQAAKANADLLSLGQDTVIKESN